MQATQLLRKLGQSLWLDNITRDWLNRGTLKRYVDALSVTGLTSKLQALADGGDCAAVLGQFAKAAIDVDGLAARLQDEGARLFVNAWNELMGVIASKSTTLAQAR